MEFKKLVSVLCSVTCGIGGVGAKLSGGMKEKIAQMKKQSEEKGSKSLMTFGNFVRNYFFPGNYSKEGEEILKARGVSGLLREDVGDIIKILESLDEDPEAKKKVLELAGNYKVKSWVKYVLRLLFAPCHSFWNTISIPALPLLMPGVLSDLWQIINNEDHKVHLAANDSTGGFLNCLFAVICIICVVSLAASAGTSALNRSSVKDWGIKEFLEELVKETGDIQNQAVVSENKLKEKKSGSSASNGGSQKSGKGSRKSKGNKRSKVKGKEVGNSAKNEVLN